MEGTYDRGGQGDSKELLAGHHHPNDARAPDYLTEILDGVRRIDDQLLHIFLTLNEDLLRHRIANQTMHPDPNRNAEIREWRLANVARCLAARERLPCTTRVLDSGAHTSDELAAMVLDGIDGRT